MIKINKLFEDIDREFDSKEIGRDDATNSMEWEISYKDKEIEQSDFRKNLKNLNTVVEDIIKINGRIKPTDPKLEELVMIIKNFRNRYVRYLNQYQPDWKDKNG